MLTIMPIATTDFPADGIILKKGAGRHFFEANVLAFSTVFFVPIQNAGQPKSYHKN